MTGELPGKPPNLFPSKEVRYIQVCIWGLQTPCSVLGRSDVFWFIPERIEIQVSEDGMNFESALDSDQVPTEGAPSRPDL